MELTWPVVHCISLDVFLKIVCVCGNVHKAMGGGEGWGGSACRINEVFKTLVMGTRSSMLVNHHIFMAIVKGTIFSPRPPYHHLQLRSGMQQCHCDLCATYLKPKVFCLLIHTITQAFATVNETSRRALHTIKALSIKY